jgi:DNA helicase-2/ATP-dependent DNA helicase PcrA
MLGKLNQLRSGGMGLQDAVRESLAGKLLKPKMYQSLKELISLIDEISGLDPRSALKTVIEKTAYMEYLREYSKGDERIYTERKENIEQLIYTASLKSDLLEYLEEASLVKEDKKEGEEEKRSGVSLSTIHSAKGLEFSVVFVVGCEENLFPHYRSLQSDNPWEIEEERRLMYVGVTRSKQYLFITSSDFRRGQFNPTSRFVEEILENLS